MFISSRSRLTVTIHGYLTLCHQTVSHLLVGGSQDTLFIFLTNHFKKRLIFECVAGLSTKVEAQT